MKYATAYGLALLIFLMLDFLWLGFVALRQPHGRTFARTTETGRRLDFYAIYVVGLVYFAINAGLEAGSWRTAALNGALFGFFTYLTYDATNLAVLKGCDPLVAVVDILRGTVIGAVVSGTTAAILISLGRI